MAVKGTDLVKLLPQKKGCRECGFPTCFAFAMKLASGGVTIDKCPYVTPENRAKIEELLTPPIRLVTIGSGDAAVEIGNEEVIWRHEKTFIHPPGIAILISDAEPEEQVEAKIRKLEELKFPWVGLTLEANLYALKFESGERGKFESLTRKIYETTKRGMILISEDLDALFAARDICADRNPLIYPITAENVDAAIPKIKERPTPVGVKAESVEKLVPITEKLAEAGIKDLVLDPGSKTFLDAIRDQTLIRRAALKQSFRPLGYPTIAFPCFMTSDLRKQALLASMFVIKYAGIIVLSDLTRETLLPLLVHRLNIYTDPRLPMQVEAKIYEIGTPDERSPLLVTTNWALTYFLVSSAIEASKVPAFLAVKDAEGLGVLTAWAAGKFSGDDVADFIKKSGIEQKLAHKTLIIPGKVARIKGELEDALPGWEIIVGPADASAIPSFLPQIASRLRGGK